MAQAIARARFWTCGTTGLKVHEAAVPPIMGNAVTAVVFPLVGGVLSLLILLTRWEAFHLLSPKWYYIALTHQATEQSSAWSPCHFWRLPPHLGISPDG